MFGSTHSTILTALGAQVKTIGQRDEQTDQAVDAELARNSYDGLSPSYNFRPADKLVLEACILSYDEAANEENPEDFHHLGWLWTEYAQLPGESHNYEHAKTAFKEAADRAAAQQDWLLLFESRL